MIARSGAGFEFAEPQTTTPETRQARPTFRPKTVPWVPWSPGDKRAREGQGRALDEGDSCKPPRTSDGQRKKKAKGKKYTPDKVNRGRLKRLFEQADRKGREKIRRMYRVAKRQLSPFRDHHVYF